MHQMVRAVLLVCLLLPAQTAFGLETLTLALPAKSFQQVIYPIAHFAVEAEQQLNRSGWKP